MAVTISSYNEILGKLVRKIIADTPVNDLNRGSVLLTLLEAVASQDFENSANILGVLESLSIDALKNSDLDQRAADYGLTRIPAGKATGFVNIKDTSITKRSTSLYAVKQAPIAGSTVIYVNDASDWDASGGSLYIGRGTQQFEGPINYSSITNNTSFYTINLSSSLQYDHLISDSVVDAQGTVDREISSGTLVKIPANNQNPEILYSILRDAVLPAGEDVVNNILIIANQVGSSSNTGINTIVEFSSPPFTNAAVSNSNSLTDGVDTESDDDFRERIKSYTSTLARGTREAILSSVVGISDSTDGKQVSSATITEPAVISDPSIVYVDDGSGFQPTYKGQSVDVILSSATGDEEFLQLANFPLPPPQVINQADGPYSLIDQCALSVVVDNSEEEILFKSSQFKNIASATLQEIATVINDNSINFKCRLTENSTRLLLYPTAHDTEFIQVSLSNSNLDANTYLKFPTNKYSYITLYKNNTLLSEKEFSATLRTIPKSSWGITSIGSLIIEVDGTPAQSRTFSSLDFDGQSFDVLTSSDWASAFNKKFAGIRALATSSDQIEISSNLIGYGSSLKISGGTYLNNMFSGVDTYAEGKTSDFALNRQTGNLQMKTQISSGDTITAGSVDAKGNIISNAASGVYNLNLDAFGRSAEIVVVADGNDSVFRNEVNPIVGTTLLITASSNKMKVISNVNTLFEKAQIGDFLYIANRGNDAVNWFDSKNCGIFKIRAKGNHTDIGTAWVEVDNKDAVNSGSVRLIQSSEDIQVFYANVYPQLWKSSYLSSLGDATIKAIVDSINLKLENVKSSIYKTNLIKLTSSTENNGSISLPISAGLMTNVFDSGIDAQLGNQSNIATKITQKDMISFFKRTEPSSSNVWLNRYVYKDLKGSLSSGSTDVFGYSEQFILNPSGLLNNTTISNDNILSITSGSNKSHFRNIKEFNSEFDLGTQTETPFTIFDYLPNDELNIVESLDISSDDSIVFILDGDSVNKTINVNFWRTGKVNTNHSASNTSFSADDMDNEAGIDFSNLQIWNKENNYTEFKDYAIWFRSRNWYRTGGTLGSGATLLLRAKEYGPNGDKLFFNIEYPTAPNQDFNIDHITSPDGSLSTYTLASGDTIPTGITSGNTFSITKNGNECTLDFKESNIDLSALNPAGGDIISITDQSVSASNRGSFRINSFNSINKTLTITNAAGFATTQGSPEIYNIQTIADVVGTQGNITITCTSEGNTSNKVGSGDYLILKDNQGNKIVYWYAVNNSGSAPSLTGIYQYIKIATIVTGDTAADVASKTAAVINGSYSDFTANYSSGNSGNSFTVFNTFNGPVVLDESGNSGTGFVYSKIDGNPNQTLGGKYFTIHDTNGSVAVWMNVYSNTEPAHGADRSIQVVIPSGSSSNNVADLIASALDLDTQFSCTYLSNVVTITNIYNGSLENANTNTSGFTIQTGTNGQNDGVETINSAEGIKVFPLIENDAQTIAENINNNSLIMTAVSIGDSSKLFTRSTKEETSSIAYDHASIDGKVKMFDGESFIKIFDNVNPNFILKKDLELQNVQPSIYNMSNCPNPNSSELGEFFKLIPKTIKNVKHHLNHRALSQLPIVADVDICNNFRRIQIKSKKLGTAGSVEVVGGRANLGEFSIFGDSQISSSSSSNMLETKISAYPSTINSNDIIKVYNEKSAKRLSRLKSTDTVDVAVVSNTESEYYFNKKDINSYFFVPWTVTDVSSLYGKANGIVWRWQHGDAGKTLNITSLTNGLISDLAFVNEYASDGSTGSVSLEVFSKTNGTFSTKLSFSLSTNSTPTNGDYFTFRNADNDTFAVWFKIGSGFSPSGTTYTDASYKIQVDILNTDSANQVIEKLKSTLLSNPEFELKFSSSDLPATSLENVYAGDSLGVWGTENFTQCNMKNQSQSTGEGEISNFPIIAVNALNRYIDVVNPNGVATSFRPLENGGNIEIFPSLGIRWRLKHSAYFSITSIQVVSGIAKVITSSSHGLGLGDTVTIANTGIVGLNGDKVIQLTPDSNSFTFNTTVSDGIYAGGIAIAQGRQRTRYKIESLGFNNLVRISRKNGDSPYFTDCGVAVDDFVKISGFTFSSVNNGFFRILAVDNDSFVIENPNFKEELDTYVKFNNLDNVVTWVANDTKITGIAGSFANLSNGIWVKKKEDSNEYLVQVISCDTGNYSTATIVNLGSRYLGSDSLSAGLAIDQELSIDQGVYLQDVNDIIFYEADSIIAGDYLVIDNISNPYWFNSSNSGVFKVQKFGTNSSSKSQYIRIQNNAAVAQSSVQMSVSLNGLYLLENENYKYESIRKVEYACINESNPNQRLVYLTPDHQLNKITSLYGSKIKSLGKLGFDVGVTSGVDGYIYYTGLMQTVQRIIDGYEPDPTNYPGRRAVGSAIEVLPPLIRQISITLDITTKDGVNLTDVTNDIKSIVINYVNSLGVGDDVVLSEIISRVMSINGVYSATFTNPVPSEQTIPIYDDQKAFISPELISLS